MYTPYLYCVLYVGVCLGISLASDNINKVSGGTMSSYLITLTKSIIFYRYKWCPDEVNEARDTSHKVVSAFLIYLPLSYMVLRRYLHI